MVSLPLTFEGVSFPNIRVNSAATIPGIISPTLTGFLITEANQTDRFHWQVCANLTNDFRLLF